MILLKMLKTFCSLALVVLSVLYVGLLLSAGLSILAGFYEHSEWIKLKWAFGMA